MKKLLALLLVISMIFSLCACSSLDEDDTAEKKKQEEKEESKSSDEEAFSLGSISDTTYESKYIGIGCELPDSWSFYSDEELESLNGFVLDRLDGDARDVVESADVIYDMYALHENGMNSININLEKVSQSQLKDIDIQENLETLIPSLKEVYESVGYSDIDSQVTTVKIDGQNFYCIRTSAQLYGTQMYMIQIQIPCTEHMAAITIASFLEDEAEDYLEYFYLID